VLTAAEAKKKLSPKLLRLPEVSGVGTPEGKLTVYLVLDTPETRRKVRSVVEAEAPDASDVRFVTTGAFSAS
jgi:hypothetical protein